MDGWEEEGEKNDGLILNDDICIYNNHKSYIVTSRSKLTNVGDDDARNKAISGVANNSVPWEDESYWSRMPILVIWFSKDLGHISTCHVAFGGHDLTKHSDV